LVVGLAASSALFLSSCASDGGLEQPNASDYAAVSDRAAAPPDPLSQPIRPGDILEVSVQEDPAFNANYTVRAEGHIMMPAIGPRVQVAGMSVRQAEKQIKSLLEQQKLRTATVTVDRVFIAPVSPLADKQQTLVYLTGKVARPGQHVLSTEIGVPMGAYEAIMVTGGLARFANGKEAHVLRKLPGGITRKLAINLDAIARGESRDLPLRRGDIVVVPEKVFGF
jgi:protein involved in polysaccharide export with SLBB domain